MSKYRDLDPFNRGVVSVFEIFPSSSRQDRRDEFALDAEPEVVLCRAWDEVSNGLEWAFEQYDPKEAQSDLDAERKEREERQHCSAG